MKKKLRIPVTLAVTLLGCAAAAAVACSSGDDKGPSADAGDDCDKALCVPKPGFTSNDCPGYSCISSCPMDKCETAV